MKINFSIDGGSAINIINLATLQNLKKVNSKLNLKATKIKIVPYGQSENYLKIGGVYYLTLETSSKFATDKFYVVNTKTKRLLTCSCTIALNLLSLNQKHYTKLISQLTRVNTKIRVVNSIWQILKLNENIISPSVLEN